MSKKRLDHYLQAQVPWASRQYIQQYIRQHGIAVNGNLVTRPSRLVHIDDTIDTAIPKPLYASRAGFKLEKALTHFGIDVRGLVALDSGLSTGGFTSCLLARGASKVYGIDVGTNQVTPELRKDPRLIVHEQTDLRSVQLPEQVDIVTLDLSFISVLKVMGAVSSLLKKDGHLIVLIKPQFEAEGPSSLHSDAISRHSALRATADGGIIRDIKIHKDVVKKVTSAIAEQGYRLIGVVASPILGGSGNKEFLAYFNRVSSG